MDKYSLFEEDTNIQGFYQFALDENEVIEHLEEDFDLVYSRGLSAFEGLLKETELIGKSSGIHPLLSKKSIIFKVISKSLAFYFSDTKFFL